MYRYELYNVDQSMGVQWAMRMRTLENAMRSNGKYTSERKCYIQVLLLTDRYVWVVRC